MGDQKVVFRMGLPHRFEESSHWRDLEIERGGSDVVGINLMNNSDDGKHAKLVIWSSRDGWQIDVYRSNHVSKGEVEQFEIRLSDDGGLKVINDVVMYNEPVRREEE